MYNTKPKFENNLDTDSDTPRNSLEVPLLSEYFTELKSLSTNSKPNRAAHFLALQATKEWLVSLPAHASPTETRKRIVLGKFLDSALTRQELDNE